MDVPQAQSTPAAFDHSLSSMETLEGNLYSTSNTAITTTITSQDSTACTDSSPIEKLNEFLQSRDVSPIRHPVTIPWEEASERTKRRHTRKAKQVVQAALKEIAPNQSEHLWQSVVESMSLDKQEDNNIDLVLMNSLAECYNNAHSWDTRRQILSIMADKVTFPTLKKWIPGLTRYRFSVARKHVLIYGRGVPLPMIRQTKMFVSQIQLDHFLDFITSPYVIQDMPFGQKSIELSTKEIVKVPNVIRMLIPETIVRQYLAYAVESNFQPLSRSTLLRILSVCSASVRKSLQGLDYISSAGTQAFDDLSVVVNQLGDEFMGMAWAKDQKDLLKSGKRYLKSDFKVHLKII